MGVQQIAVTPSSFIKYNRSRESRPPPGIIMVLIILAPSSAAQKPMNGPKENGTNKRSFSVSPAPVRTNPQHRPHHSQLSGVSKTRNGFPVVPDV